MPDTPTNCSQYYGHTTHPNLMSEWDVDDALKAYTNILKMYSTFAIESCYTYYNQLMCYLYFPQ